MCKPKGAVASWGDCRAVALRFDERLRWRGPITSEGFDLVDTCWILLLLVVALAERRSWYHMFKW